MSRVLSKSTHKLLVENIQKLPYRNRVEALNLLFPQVCVDTLKCVVAQECQKRMKISHSRLTALESVEDMYERYLQAISRGEEPGILLRLSDETGLVPALLARTIVERHYQKPDKTSFEYEIRLRMELEERKMTFLHEDHLRAKGYDKTPDIKLEIPVAVDGQVINWIESKALFGDEETHRTYLKEQLYSYWNRFGPGLVVYWFGYVDDLEKIHGNRTILIRDALPSNMALMEQDPHRQAATNLTI
uniref:CDAN1-interacting nuclease 1 n=1 Tax=Alona affinis TaxID=381656 RepID=A0A9N6WTT2_9CRUS|nr:EOG090X0A0V [Alona affinis]